MTDLNSKDNKVLVQIMLDEIFKHSYNEVNKHFGSMTIQNLLKLKSELHKDEVCEHLHITREHYEIDPENYELEYYLSTMED